MNKICYIIFLLLVFSCGQPNNDTQIDKQYFDFDQITHYKFDITEDEVFNLYEYTTPNDSLLNNILIQDNPYDILDTGFLSSLDVLSTTKTLIDTSLHEDFRNLFKEKKHDNPIYASCIATWRDIVIFKKENLTVGIAKICFGCNRNRIIGTLANTEEFGQSGDYEKLKQLLESK